MPSLNVGIACGVASRDTTASREAGFTPRRAILAIQSAHTGISRVASNRTLVVETAYLLGAAAATAYTQRAQPPPGGPAADPVPIWCAGLVRALTDTALTCHSCVCCLRPVIPGAKITRLRDRAPPPSSTSSDPSGRRLLLQGQGYARSIRCRTPGFISRLSSLLVRPAGVCLLWPHYSSGRQFPPAAASLPRLFIPLRRSYLPAIQGVCLRRRHHGQHRRHVVLSAWCACCRKNSSSPQQMGRRGGASIHHQKSRAKKNPISSPHNPFSHPRLATHQARTFSPCSLMHSSTASPSTGSTSSSVSSPTRRVFDHASLPHEDSLRSAAQPRWSRRA